MKMNWKSLKVSTFPILIVLVSLYGAGTCRADTITVPNDYATIEAAIAAAAEGDTILVNAGTYRENIIIDKALYLIGVDGAEATIIEDVEADPNGGSGAIVVLVDSSGPGEIAGFTITGNQDVNGAGIYLKYGGWLIYRCKVSTHSGGIISDATNRIIENEINGNSGVGIGVKGQSVVRHNRVVGNGTGVSALDSVLVANNVIANSFTGIATREGSDQLRIQNNVITTIGHSNEGSQQKGMWLIGHYEGDDSIIQNNVVAYCGREGIRFSATTSDGRDASDFQFIYNNVFGTSEDYDGLENQTGQNGNLGVEPLFCDNDGLFYLASDSPLIDAGSLDLADLDGSRNDIGMFGGPEAQGLMYAPASFSLESPQDTAFVQRNVVFEWASTFDLDPDDEIIYRLIIGRSRSVRFLPGFRESGSGNSRRSVRVGGVIDTLYTRNTELALNLDLPDSTYYWTVEAEDLAGLFKRANEVWSFRLVTATATDDVVPLEPSGLIGNYPNPFFAETRISYQVASYSHVRLTVFDLLGREIVTLVDDHKNAGEHYVLWNIDETSIRLPASGVYFYKFETENVTEVRKMLLIH